MAMFFFFLFLLVLHSIPIHLENSEYETMDHLVVCTLQLMLISSFVFLSLTCILFFVPPV